MTRQPGRFFRWSERGFAALQRWYGRSLRFVLRHPLSTMLVFLATVILNIHLYVTIPKGFFPQQDTGRIVGGIRADQSISFQAMRRKFRAVHGDRARGSGGRKRGRLHRRLLRPTRASCSRR